jgi:predicted dehydrogenase
MPALTRREWLQTGAALAATSLMPRAIKAAPSERVGIAVLGGGRGLHLASMFAQLPDAQVVAVCDVDEARQQKLLEAISPHQSLAPRRETDFRRLLEAADVDALAVATPDHWHSPITIHACLAGKDVYVEKPLSHNIAEGRIAVTAARKHQRIVQHGTNLRAVPHYAAAWDILHSGQLGRILMVKAINNQRRGRLEPRADEPAPAGVDYDLWLGPAAQRPFNPNRFHSGWHWLWDYGTGDIGNDGVHQLDLGRWAMQLKAPKAVSCSGAKLGSKGDAQDCPDTMVVTYEYDDLLYVYEQRDFTPYRQLGHRVDNDNVFFGENGYLMVDRNGYRVFYKGGERGPELEQAWQDTPRHYQNFVDCVKSRKAEDLLADVEEGHYSALLSHLGNISYRTGRRLTFDPQQEIFVGDDDANRLLTREYRRGFELPAV